jgi:GTP-binding protein EngB required for normal cell division
LSQLVVADLAARGVGCLAADRKRACLCVAILAWTAMELADNRRSGLMAPPARRSVMPEREAVEFRVAAWADAAADLALLAAEVAPELSVAAAEVADRLAAGRFHISVVGEFKRGKSTLVNALLGRKLLPTGVLPLTAVTVEVAYGPEGAVVEHGDGRRVRIGVEELAVFATEEHNPGNRRDVTRVLVTLPAGLLASGAVLVDTPGLGSTHAHSTEAAQRAVSATDGAVVVFSADAPFSQQERDLLDALRGRSARTFFVLNRVDHLDADGLAQVQEFVTATLRDALWRDVEVFPVSARRALRASADGGLRDAGFDAFARELRRFIDEDLASARAAAARRDVCGLADRIDAAVELESAALELTAEELDARLVRFAGEVARQRQAFVEDRLLLGHAVEAIARDLADRLRAAAGQVPPQAAERLVEVAEASPAAGMELALDDAVADLVRDWFEQLRPALAGEVEDAWLAAAGDFRARVEQRVASAREAAEDLLDRALPAFPVPSVAAVPEEFSYEFERLPHSGESVARALRWLAPRLWLRARLVRRARRRLADQLDKHAGRARYDLVRRLHEARDAFVGVLAGHLDALIDGVTAAAERAQARRGAVGAQLDAERQRVAAVRRRTEAARRAVQAG